MTNTTPIASLQPFEPIPLATTLDAEVSLVWPYSSSHASCALLLVHPDFRQRHARGEVRARFQGAAAKAIAEAHVGIGDRIRLNLQGARWSEPDRRALNLTPGKPLEAELLFEKNIRLAILDEHGEQEEKVIDLGNDIASPKQNKIDAPPSTPGPALSQQSHVATLLRTPAYDIHGSPHMKRLRLSQGHYLNSPGLATSRHSIDGPASSGRRSGSFGTRWTLLRSKPTFVQARDDDDVPAEGDQAALLMETSGIVSPERNITAQLSYTQQSNMTDDQILSTQQSNQDPFIDTPGRPIPSDRDMNIRPPSQPPAAVMPPPPKFGARIAMPDLASNAFAPSAPRLFPVSPGSLPLPSPFPQTPISTGHQTLRATDGSHTPIVSRTAATVSESMPLGYFDIPSTMARPLPMSTDATLASAAAAIEARDDQDATELDPVVASPVHQQKAGDAHNVEVPDAEDIPASPSSGSAADVSSMATPLNKPAAHPAPTLMSSVTLGRPLVPDSFMAEEEVTVIEDDSDRSSEDEDIHEVELLSGRSTPSDDEEDGTFTTQPTGMLLDFALASSQFASEMPSPIIPSAPSPAKEVEKINIQEVADAANADPEDEDAAWQAMNFAMHELAPNAHEKQQAPTIPLTSVLVPHLELAPPNAAQNAVAESPTVAHVSEEVSRGPTTELSVKPSTAGATQPTVAEAMPSLEMDEMKGQAPQTATHGPVVELPIVLDHPTLLPEALRSPTQATTKERQQDIGPVTSADLAPDGAHKSDTAAIHSIARSPEKLDRTITDSSTIEPEAASHPPVEKVELLPEKLAAEDTGLDEVKATNGPDHKTEAVAEGSPKEAGLAPQEVLLHPTISHAQEDALSAVKDVRAEVTTAADKPDQEDPMGPLLKDEIPAAATKLAPTGPPTVPDQPEKAANDAPNPLQKPSEPIATEAPPLSWEPPSLLPLTPLSYLTPLSSLGAYLNSPSPIDVLAVITASSSPVRSKAGPRDWTLSLSLTHPCLSSTDASSVGRGNVVKADIFRPYKPSLPIAEAGSVVLLRGVLVKSRARKLGLLSGPESGWCVFRWGKEGVEEDVRGPPVEVGGFEREMALRLRRWWEGRQ